MAFKITQLAPDVIDGTGYLSAYYDSATPEESVQCTFIFKSNAGEAVSVDKMKVAARAFLLRVANEL